MLTPGEIWPMIAGSAVVVYGAGHFIGSIVTKISNGKHVTKEVCSAVHMATAEHLKRIDINVDRIWRRLDGQTIEGDE
jgi:hypothetical protein